MLVLARKEGQKIQIKELGVEITIVDLSHKEVRIGITAPANATILREELVRLEEPRKEGREL